MGGRALGTAIESPHPTIIRWLEKSGTKSYNVRDQNRSTWMYAVWVSILTCLPLLRTRGWTG